MTWAETASETFVARHDARDEADATRVLAQLEYAREGLERRLDVQMGELSVVLHGSPAQLDAAQPWIPLQRRLTAPAARRYVVGWAAERELHVLAPRLLATRASNVEGSLEMLMLAPSALLARQALALRHPGFPPPLGPLRLRRWMRDAWFVEGAAQWLSGQTRHVRPGGGPAAARGRTARVPPGRRRRAPAGRNGVRPAGARGGRQSRCGRHPRRAGGVALGGVPRARCAAHRGRLALAPAPSHRSGRSGAPAAALAAGA